MSTAATQQTEQQVTFDPMDEAPISLNVRVINPDGFDVQITIRERVASDNRADGRAFARLNTILTKLKGDGWTPAPTKGGGYNGGAQRAEPNGEASPASSVPSCRIHGGEMKPSKKSGSFFCTRKNADGSYCKETAGE
jgi:hypothetical protein